MKKSFKKIVVSLVSMAAIAANIIGLGANATSSSSTGSALYGSCRYTLSVNSEHTSTGGFENKGSVDRYVIMQLYLINPVTNEVLASSIKQTDGTVTSHSSAYMFKAFGSHSSTYIHGYKGILYGSSNPTYSSVVETILLTAAC